MRYEISKIARLFPEWYNKEFPLSYEDQKWIWENVPLPEEDEIRLKELDANESGSVRSESDTYKSDANSELNWYKSDLILQLKQCSSETPPAKIASLLEEIFKYWPPNKQKHWLWVAQTYTARTLNWVMSATIRKHLQGGIRRTPASYFTFQLRFRKTKQEFRRKESGNTNDTY